MKLRLLTLGVALGAIALTGTAVAGPAQPAETLTIAHSWRIEHDNLLRQFSHGLGVDLSDRSSGGGPG
jgi:ABC-type glycerol-3-phosphate transport system substrate-binding protein